jgi:hypothetical protein
MAAESTTTTVTGGINASLLVKIMSNYAIDINVLLPRARYEPVANGTGTAAFTSTTKASAAAITEASGMSNTALTQASTTVAASEVGILRQITKKAGRFHVLGDAGLTSFAIEDGSKLVLEKMETDGLAQFTNASTSQGTSGANFTIANGLGGISQLSINKARGAKVMILSTFQARDLRAQIGQSSSPILQFIGGAQLLAGPDEMGFTGTFAGVPVFETNLAPAASSDKVGAIFIDGFRNPENAPTGCALGWMPELETIGTPELPGKRIALTACYGFGEISDFNYTKFVTIGS